MKERGILYTPENIQLILDDLKRQTRRIIRPQPDSQGAILQMREMVEQPGTWVYNGQTFTCPYGTTGDRLYVKEGLKRKGGGIFYRRDDVMVPELDGPKVWRWQRNTLSPRHMPKDCARLWLEITNVRIERVQDISQHDAAEEGCGDDLIVPPRCRIRYEAIWSGIHGYTGEDSWAANPYVWAISFRRIKS
jgi:hypothetical protein